MQYLKLFKMRLIVDNIFFLLQITTLPISKNFLKVNKNERIEEWKTKIVWNEPVMSQNVPEPNQL